MVMVVVVFKRLWVTGGGSSNGEGLRKWMWVSVGMGLVKRERDREKGGGFSLRGHLENFLFVHGTGY